MISMDEMAPLKRKHRELEIRMEKIGKKQCSSIVALSKSLEGLMDDIEATREREKQPRNQAITAKIKVVKCGIRLSKKLKYFEEEVVREFDRGNLAEETGRKFISVTKLIKRDKMPDAKAEFGYFQEIAKLVREYESSTREIGEAERAIKAEQRRIKTLLGEMSWVERQRVNPEKVRRHEELLRALEGLEKLRKQYLHSLSSKPVALLLGDAGPLREHIPVFPEKGGMAELRDFFSEYPALGAYNAHGICGLFAFSEKKISHLCPEVSRFKKTVLGNKKCFEALRSLGQSGFLAIANGDGNMLDFYSRNVPGAEKLVVQAKLLGKGETSSAEEYGKSRKIREKKKQLSAYSRRELEAGLEKADSLLEFLNSPPEAEAKEEPVKEREGLLSQISSFFRK